MTRPLLLDLYCGAGGATMGYWLAGFDVVGVDRDPQPRYPFAEFHQADALDFLDAYGHEFSAIHASPPCQAHTALKTMHNAKAHVDLIAATRHALRRYDVPWVIENVEGAPLVDPTLLCGTMFDLGTANAELRRHRLFESNLPILAPRPCRHDLKPHVIGIYGGHVRNRKRRDGSHARGVADFSREDGCLAMGINWMTLGELSQAVPPAFTRYIGGQLLAAARGLSLAAA